MDFARLFIVFENENRPVVTRVRIAVDHGETVAAQGYDLLSRHVRFDIHLVGKAWGNDTMVVSVYAPRQMGCVRLRPDDHNDQADDHDHHDAA